MGHSLSKFHYCRRLFLLVVNENQAPIYSKIKTPISINDKLREFLLLAVQLHMASPASQIMHYPVYRVVNFSEQRFNKHTYMNKKFTPTPHDAVFKQFLGDKDVVRDFFSIWLPKEIKKLCQLDSLKLESSSFVDSEMKNYQSDILYSVKTTQGNGYPYCLVEHVRREGCTTEVL